MGSSYSNEDFKQTAIERSYAAKLGHELRSKRMALANKIVLAIVDKISNDIIRPGPKPEERECYVMAEELRNHSEELKILVMSILKVEQEG